MYYLRRGANADPEGPYSLEYLSKMAREGKLAPSDQLIDAESESHTTVGELLGNVSDIQWRSQKSSTSAAQMAIVGMLLLAGLCLLPLLTALPRMERTISGGVTRSTDSAAGHLEALREITRAAEMYCYQHDGFFPSGMDSERWKEQLRPYISDPSVLDPGPDQVLGANPNLNNIRQGSVIDPYRTLMFYITPSSRRGDAAASNVDGQFGIVRAEELQKSIDSGIFNVPD